MTETVKNIAIGVIVAISLTLILWVLLFLHPSFGDGAFKLHVRFANIEKVGIGTRVTYAGRPIGEVVKIKQVPEKERYASHNSAQLYIYDLTLALDSHVPLYDSDEITMGTSGLMGERFISIIPKRPNSKPANLLTCDQVVYSAPAPSVEDAFAQISKLTLKAEETVKVMSNLVEENRDEVKNSLRAIRSASSQLNTLLANINKTDLVGSLSHSAMQVERTMAAAETAINKMNESDVIAKLDATINSLDSMVNKVASGQGSVGKLLAHDDAYFKTIAIMNKMDTMMNDVTRYGVLFHLDKGWQREQRKSQEVLARIKNQQEKQIADETK